MKEKEQGCCLARGGLGRDENGGSSSNNKKGYVVVAAAKPKSQNEDSRECGVENKQ